MGDYSCMGCDQRYSGCHSRCDKYIIDKAFHDALKAEDDKKKQAKYTAKAQRDAQVGKAIRKLRREFGKW